MKRLELVKKIIDTFNSNPQRYINFYQLAKDSSLNQRTVRDWDMLIAEHKVLDCPKLASIEDFEEYEGKK